MSRSRIPKALRAKVAAQARYRCGYCLTAEPIVGTSMELDHLIPEALGGLTEEDNLWLACSLCNDSKGCRIAAEDPSTVQERSSGYSIRVTKIGTSTFPGHKVEV